MGMKKYYPFPGRPDEVGSQSVTVGGVVLDESSQEYILDMADAGEIVVLVEEEVASRKGITLDKADVPCAVV